MLSLETFGGDGLRTAPLTDPTKTAHYQNGYQAGQAAAKIAFENDQSALKAALVHELADMSFGFAEAQAHVLSELTPLLHSILHVILPATMTSSLTAQLNELISQAMVVDATAKAQLWVHPDQKEAVTSALADLNHPNLVVVSDAHLTRHAAITSLSTGETSLDLDAALTLVSGVVANWPVQAKRNNK